MAAESVANQTKSFIDLFIVFFDWPFLLFVLLVLFAYHFKEKINGLLERGDIQISWGDNKYIKLKDLSEGIDKEIDPLKEEIDDLKEKINEFGRIVNSNNGKESKSENARLTDNQKIEAEKRIYDGLNNFKYRWRSIERLAAISGITESEVLDILRSNPGVVLSMSKSKKPIAQLRLK